MNPQPEPLPQDYVVALENGTHRVLSSWTGTRYRSYDETKVTQYRIAMATSKKNAEARAKAIAKEFGR